MSPSWRVVATLLLGLVACDEATGPAGRGTGGLVLQVVAAPAASATLDSGYVVVSGPTNRTVKATPGTTVTIDGLQPGTYTVELEGFAGGGLARYGAVSGVAVVAGQTSTATLSSFSLLRLAFKVPPSDVRLGRAISPAVQVSIVDSVGNVITRATNSVTVALGSNPGGCPLRGTLTVNAVAGVASFSDLSIGETGAGYALTASSGVLTGATSTPFNVFTFVWVANYVSATVSVIETAINTVIATIPVGGSPNPVNLAVTPDGSGVYVTSQSSNNVSVISTATNAVVATVPLAGTSQEVAITPDGASAYVTNPSLNQISVISTATNVVGATIPLQAGSTSPLGVAVRPDGQFAYTANNVSNNVAVINTATKGQIATPGSGGTQPQSVGVTPSGAFAYVTNATSNTVGVVSTATSTLVATVPVGAFPRGVAVTPDGAFAWVANLSAGTVSVLRTSDNVVTAVIPVGNSPSFIAFTPCGAFAYVTNTGANSVSVIATATQTVVATITGLGSQPTGIAISRAP